MNLWIVKLGGQFNVNVKAREDTSYRLKKSAYICLFAFANRSSLHLSQLFKLNYLSSCKHFRISHEQESKRKLQLTSHLEDFYQQRTEYWNGSRYKWPRLETWGSWSSFPPKTKAPEILNNLATTTHCFKRTAANFRPKFAEANTLKREKCNVKDCEMLGVFESMAMKV